MIVTCPSCAAQFLVPNTAVGATGRKVRCSACGAQWFQDPPSERGRPLETGPDPALAGAAAAATVSTATASAEASEAEPPEGPDAGDLEQMIVRERQRPTHINLPAVPAPVRGRRGVMIGWIALAVVVVGLVAGFFLARDRIVAFWPPAVKAYDLVGIDVTGAAIREFPAALAFTQPPALAFSEEAGRPVLTIEVLVANDGDTAHRLPPLEMSLSDEAGETVDRWVEETGWPSIGPGETLAVTARRVEPPESATDIHIEPAAVPRSERPDDAPPAEAEAEE